MPTSIRLEPEIEARLNALAARTGRTKAYYLRELIANGLDDLEDYYAAVEVSERIRRGEERTYLSEDVRRELGLDD
ncbi:ribbon-helix-helix protein, CopG family [Aquibium carbonis]|uniref:Ribbon-helix-helix protein, CopG family n=1 Tax=Aquibium carbonis TaxID=2495581 RepID=A0A3S0AQ64_9HYPH|nr:ribbon-helix-helix protein, CopG family [Aquibium carbonis]RST84494.1 ribbon-helix-helix protein, CopG family [Aquibium carbonis]